MQREFTKVVIRLLLACADSLGGLEFNGEAIW